MEGIKISVILPNYNSEKYITRAISSFLSQNYSNKELIIVDGKSTDNSHDIINSFVSNNANIIWIKEKDINVTDGINIGLKYCSGDFMAFLASDVFYYTDDLFSTINFNYSLVPFDGVYFDYYSYNPKEKKVSLLKCPTIHFNKNNLLTYGTIAGFDNVFISKKIYQEYKYNPEFNLCSDWEFFLRITERYSLFMYIEKIATVNVQDGYNLSSKYSDEQMRQIKHVAEIYNTDKVIPYFSPPVNPTIKSQVRKTIGMIYRKIFKS